MNCVFTVVTVLLGVSWATAQYLNNRPYPTYSLEHMPDTGFTCRAKVLGGYYADSETQCQMFHVCVKVAGLGVQDFRFLCPNGTAFDQDNQICAEWDDVDCEAATLYYSSDNFDLYRVGSGFETAAFPGENEETFHLQRSETGDTRLSKERETVRVNQQTNYNTIVPPKKPQFNKERDILRGSSSSNFFNNRNGGKENDDDYEEPSPNRNVEIPKKKIIRKLNRRPEETEATQAPRPNRPTGFSNNFAGSIPSSTTGRTISTTTALTSDQYTTAVNNYRGRQRNRGNERQYNNADNFRYNDNNNRNNENGQYNSRQGYNNQATSPGTPAPLRQPINNNDGQYNRNQYNNQQTSPSIPAPFRQQETRQYKNVNRPSNQFDSVQVTTITSAPKLQYNNQSDTQRVRQQPEVQTTGIAQQQTFNAQYDTARIRQHQEIQTTAVTNKQIINNQYKQTEDYPSTPASFRQTDYNKQTSLFKKESENYPTTAQFANKQTFNNQYESQKKSIVTQTQKQTENYPTTTSFTNKQTFNTQFAIQKKPTTQFKQSDNYPTTFAPSKQNFQNKQTQFYQKQTENYPTTAPAAVKQENTQYENQYTNRQTTFNQQFTQSVVNKQQYDSTRFTNTQFNQQFSTTIRPTTIHTQYTPTVPKQTTQYQYISTTPAARFSKQYDETNYDDGSYNAKYDDEKYKPDDEFLKTAHSQNFASSRNELASSSKINIPIPTSQPPRPFSVTTNAPKLTPPPRETQSIPKSTNYEKSIAKSTNYDKPSAPKPTEIKPQPSQQPKKPKSDKDVSYDYAYYDTNVGSEPDYDVGTEFARSTKKSN